MIMSSSTTGKAYDAAVQLYRRAPASVLTLVSVLASYLMTIAYEDYTLFKALGQGGLGKPSVWTWVVHTFALRPLAMPKRASIDPECLPLDDQEWTERQAKSNAKILSSLPQRQGPRPFTFGMVPHRQLQHIAPAGGEMQKAIIEHLEELAHKHSKALVLALSTYEATDSPCLFVRHASGNAHSKPTKLARYYLNGTPSPKFTLKRTHLEPDSDLHELCHIHLSDGSLHLILSPQDARKVISQGWGELHRLAGMLYRGHYVPPYWLPRFMYSAFGGESKMRWGYQRRAIQHPDVQPAGKMLPPTYTSVYAPTNAEQLAWTKSIIDSSVAWALGQTEI